QLSEIRAAIALNRDQPAKSVELLASASPYERAYFDAVYLRGLAYLRLHKGAEAAVASAMTKLCICPNPARRPLSLPLADCPPKRGACPGPHRILVWLAFHFP